MTDSRTNQHINRELTRRGAIIMSLVGLVWALAGASGIAQGMTALVVRVVALIITASVVLVALRGDTSRIERQRRLPENWPRLFNLVGIAQAVAIGLAVLIFVVAGVPGLIPPMVCLIVGIHFFPLASILDQPQYLGTGVVLCAFAVVGVVALAAVDEEVARTVVGLGAALTLWATSLYIARHG